MTYSIRTDAVSQSIDAESLDAAARKFSRGEFGRESVTAVPTARPKLVRTWGTRYCLRMWLPLNGREPAASRTAADRRPAQEI